MSVRDWVPELTAGGIILFVALIFIAFSPEQKEERGGCKHGAEYHCADALRDWPESVVPHPPHVQPPPTGPNPERENWRNERDLEAQWETARWTWLAVVFASFWSLASLVATGVGIYFVRRTLQANLEAIATAENAIRSERESSQAQVRAYLSISEPVLEVAERDSKRATVRFKVINSGNSPALRTEIWFGISDKGSVASDSIVPACGVLIGTIRQNTAEAAKTEHSDIANPIFEGTARHGYAQIYIRIFACFEDVFEIERLEKYDFGAVIPFNGDYPMIVPLTEWSGAGIPRMLMWDPSKHKRRDSN